MTKKELQLQENEIVLDHYTKLKEKLDREIRLTQQKKRLRTMSAEVLVTPNYILLESYGTLVAFIPRGTERCIDVLRYVYGYTPTSAKHISAFAHEYGANKRYTWKEV